MAKTRDARQPIEDASKAKDSIQHVVHDYTILLWCRWAVQQADEIFPPIVRSHLAFSYFLPYRAFADFFSMKRFVPDNLKTADVDIQAIDYSDHASYDRTKWERWLPHMNTHLFHLNYFRVKITISFDSVSVITSLHPEFEANWKKFIGGLREPFPKLFREHVDAKRGDFPNLTLYP